MHHNLSTLISPLSLDGFRFRFRIKLAKGHSSATKGFGSLLKAVKRSKSRSSICLYFCRGHVNFTTRISYKYLGTTATTAESKKRKEFSTEGPSTGQSLAGGDFFFRTARTASYIPPLLSELKVCLIAPTLQRLHSLNCGSDQLPPLIEKK